MRRRSLADDQRAAVYVEFLVVFMPVFMLFLGMTQMSLMFTAKIVVKHSADVAARSAIVILPDDPAAYGGATPKNTYDFGGVNADNNGVVKVLEGIASLLRIETPTNWLSTGDGRINRIRLAAFRPLMAVIPPPDSVFSFGNPARLSAYAPNGAEAAENVVAAVGHGEEGFSATGQRFLAGLFYLSQAAAVTFPGNSSPVGWSRDGDNPFTARVSYSFACLVPGAAKLMCDGWSDLSSNQPDGWGEMDGAVARGTALLNGNGLYYILRAEATLTYQGATYDYYSGGS